MWILLATALATCAPAEALDHFEVTTAQPYQVADLPIDVTIAAVDANGEPVAGFCGPAAITGLRRVGADGPVPLATTGAFRDGRTVLEDVLPGPEPVVVTHGAVSTTWQPSLRRIPGVLSIMPPLLAIALAVVLRRALIALFAGVWLGALFVHGYNPLTGLLRCFDTYLPKALADHDHAATILFTMALGGIVGIVGKSGGTRALVDILSRRARTRRSGMVSTWLAGIFVFFDDYANCLLVGNTIRPFSDSRRISREKLSFLVDSTAAPVSTIALVSTWIGYQLGLIGDAGVTLEGNAYDTFLSMLPYSFYAFFTLFFVLMVAVTQRDFGPMLRAEQRAIHAGQVLRPGAQPLMDQTLTEMEPYPGRALHWYNAVIPIAFVILAVVVGLYASGVQALGDRAADLGLRKIIGAADSYAVLLWSSFGGSMVALITAVGSRALTVSEGVNAWIDGVKSMVMAVLILVLAWTIGDMCKSYLQTGPWILSQFAPSPHWLPLITFVICALIALATGSSFSTMAIVIPIAAPMAWALTTDVGLAADAIWGIRHGTLAAVLSGAVFGDHCSPISDTTIMSSMASAADHVNHVRTQAPYAILCATVAALVGYIPAGFGVSPLISFPAGIAALLAVLFLVGKRADQAT